MDLLCSLYLGRTNEYTETYGFVPGIEGKSSLARLGLQVHMTAGFGDVGFKGFWTLEMTCLQPLRIYRDMRIAQLYYDELTGEYDDYEGKYQDNKGVGSSKSYEDFKS
jgi:dCTP deaminase